MATQQRPQRPDPVRVKASTRVAWLVAVALALPAFAPLVAHYVGFLREQLQPTGFLIYDTPYYMANAREHFDAGGFSFFYGSPFSYDYGTLRIYFQPLTLILGFLIRLPGADPGFVFGAVGLVAAIVCSTHHELCREEDRKAREVVARDCEREETRSPSRR